MTDKTTTTFYIIYGGVGNTKSFKLYLSSEKQALEFANTFHLATGMPTCLEKKEIIKVSA